jgi:sarcosine oxidase
MTNSSDVIIAGMGAMGSAASYHLARRGLTVLGFDRFNPPHTFGSSHGQTRAIRETYFEHPLYVPIVQRAYTLWDELEQASGEKLFRQTGGLMIGPRDSILVSGAQESAEIHHLTYELLSARETHSRFPALHPPDEMTALWEPRAGVLAPERCIQAHINLAKRCGARLHTDEPVTGWSPEGEGVRVSTTRGEYFASTLIISAGAWAAELLPELPLWVERQIFCWFEPLNAGERFAPENCPLTIWEHAPGHFFCGFPDVGDGVKVARHHDGERTTANSVRRTVSAEEVDDLRQFVQRFMSSANGPLKASTVCMYTNTPDGNFLIDRHPDCSRVLIVSPCSGHGFKFSSAVGEITAELVADGASQFDLTPFSIARLANSVAA